MHYEKVNANQENYYILKTIHLKENHPNHTHNNQTLPSLESHTKKTQIITETLKYCPSCGSLSTSTVYYFLVCVFS